MSNDRLRGFDEYMMSLYQYDNLSCLSCNRLKYVCLYKHLYRAIRSGELKPKEVLDTQRHIFYAIIELRSEEGCEYFSVEDTVILFRMLVTMMLQIYVIGVDPFNLVALNADLDYDNDIYNQQEIEKLLDYAEQLLKMHRRTYIVVSDLCLGNLQFGDLLINNKGSFRGIEVKSGKKNKKITKLVYKGKKNPYDKATNKTDWEHFERAKKQWERSKIISQQLQSKYYINGDKGIVIYPYWADEFDSFGKILSNIIEESHEHLYREVTVDENISIITINRAAYKAYKRELAPPCLYLMFNDLLQRSYNEDDISKIEQFYNSEFSDCDIYKYNSVIYDYSAPQPFIWDIDENGMIDLFDDGVEVFIKIKLDSLFDYLREQGFKIYPKKQIPFPYLFTYKNKMWMIDYKECGPAGAGAFTIDTLKRIFCGMYTSQGLADYLKTECRDFEQGVRALLQEVESQ